MRASQPFPRGACLVTRQLAWKKRERRSDHWWTSSGVIYRGAIVIDHFLESGWGRRCALEYVACRAPGVQPGEKGEM